MAATGSSALFLKAAAEDSAQVRCLGAWLDTLYPADEISPAASALGVHLAIEKKAVSVSNYTELLLRGTAWADGEAAALGKRTFADLDEADRRRLVSAAEGMDSSSIAGMFYLHTLRDGAHFYYSREESWPVTGFPHPPQPIGFPDYSERPSP